MDCLPIEIGFLAVMRVFFVVVVVFFYQNMRSPGPHIYLPAQTWVKRGDFDSNFFKLKCHAYITALAGNVL